MSMVVVIMWATVTVANKICKSVHPRSGDG